eukprot:COSAG01_NODE_746_length_13865_cov_11.259625_3_plen_236_part_00
MRRYPRCMSRLVLGVYARYGMPAPTARTAAAPPKPAFAIAVRTFLGPRNTASLDFLPAVRQGLATDGGLYIPRGGPPAMTKEEWGALLPMTYEERAVAILSRWIPSDELSEGELQTMVSEAYSGFGHCGDRDAVAPIVHLEGNQYILELFHGPTASFKDLALQLTPRLFARAAQGSDTSYLILVATSGDTGSAALDGFGNVDIPTMVLYPQGGVSSIQRAQMVASPRPNPPVCSW